MKRLEHHPQLHAFNNVASFAEAFKINPQDLILTNRFILNAQEAFPEAQVIYQEEFGTGEPNDAMLYDILTHAKPRTRVIGIGGGTVLDLAKLLSLSWSFRQELYGYFTGRDAVKKDCPCVLVPTTCGTGSEVTNVAVLHFSLLGMKMGLGDDALYATDCIWIPSLLKTMPYKTFAFSSIDALIHSIESFLSPKANESTRYFSLKAAKIILDNFERLTPGILPNEEDLKRLLQASTYAGIAFNTAGCGLVHALSYPIGGKYNVAHGEANYMMLFSVLQYYQNQTEKTSLIACQKEFSRYLDCKPEEVLSRLESLLHHVWQRRSLKEVGLTNEDFVTFSEEVYRRQQRLLSNSMCSISMKDLSNLYKRSY